jgi:hypothetical protein
MKVGKAHLKIEIIQQKIQQENPIYRVWLPQFNKAAGALDRN